MNAALQTLILSLQQGGGIGDDARCLFLGAQPHPDLPQSTTGWQPSKPAADLWDAAGRPRLDSLPDDARWPLVLVLPGKSRDETLAWFALARDHLEAGGRIVAAMPNSAGAGRFEKEFKKASGDIISVSKNKCRAFHADDDGSWDESQFASWRDLGKPSPIPGTDFLTEPGVFSSDHIDPGSQLLADHLPNHIAGKTADLGAGWGFLSDHLLCHSPRISQLDLYEADARALNCARTNLARHTNANLGIHWHDVRQGIDGSYDTIVMNPPFHTGQTTDIDLGRAFIHTAATALRRGGKLFIVANRQLPYEAELDALNLHWRIAAEDTKFKLLFAIKR